MASTTNIPIHDSHTITSMFGYQMRFDFDSQNYVILYITDEDAPGWSAEFHIFLVMYDHGEAVAVITDTKLTGISFTANFKAIL